MMKVLIGYDGSESANPALDELKKAALPAETEILIAAAGDFWTLPADIATLPADALVSRRVSSTVAQLHNQNVQAFEEAEELLEGAARQVQSDFPDWKIQTEFLRGDAPSALLQKAGDWNADLIIVGSHNRTAVGRFLFGSVSQKIIIEAKCSVRVARAATENNKDAPRRIVAGVDNSQSAHSIVRAISRRQWTKDSVIMLVTATDGFDRDPAEPVKQIIASQKIQQSAKAMLNAKGLKVLTNIKEGDAKSVLLAEAEKLRADCIFVSTRGLQGILERFFAGSVSTSIVAQAPCSVEVVR